MKIYDFNVNTATGETVSLSQYEGKVLLVINSATQCGFTPQYKDLQNMYETYASQGLEILDFPCNQFGSQAPGTDDEIRAFCETRFGITFPTFSKIDVNGPGADPLFVWLEGQKGFEGFGKSPMGLALKVMLKKADSDYASKPDIKWNFTKFLIDRSGEVVARFEPTQSMKRVEEKVKLLL